jgi:tRNA G46 methylase TrmB
MYHQTVLFAHFAKNRECTNAMFIHFHDPAEKAEPNLGRITQTPRYELNRNDKDF